MNDSCTPDDLRLRWPRPAEGWTEAAPVGNGRLGAMVFGGVGSARYQINDSTVWSGTPDGPARALEAVRRGGAGPERLAEIRAAVRAGDHRRAESLLMSFEGDYSQEYLPFTDLVMGLESAGPDTTGEQQPGSYLGRTLDLDNGVVEEEIRFGERTVRRLSWASGPAGALCVEVTADAGTVGMTLDLTSPLRELDRVCDPSGLVLGVAVPVDGAPLHEPQVPEPLRYAQGPTPGGYDPYAALAVRIDTDGRVSTGNGRWSVSGMTRALITVASSTSGAAFWSRAAARNRTEHRAGAAAVAERALAAGRDRLLREHQDDLRSLLAASALRIGPRRAGTFDVRDDLLPGTDDALTATVMFQLGRYLLASSSRPGTGPPANLQGIWNEELRPAWSSNYTLNINTEMNYWPAETTGLGECHLPLFDLLDRMAENGAEVARDLYGARGWVVHHNSDMWGWSLPAGRGHGNPSWAIWMMGGTWLAQHIWDHYDFTRDTQFLRERGWPLLSGQAAFCLDWLVEGADGLLDTVPSTSPENLFRSGAGTPESLTRSATMDMALIRALFTNCLEAARALGLRDPLCAEIEAALPRLRTPAIAGGGWLQEWAEDLTEVDPVHRHMSQMVTVFPLGQIDPDTTPDLAAAATRLLERRGPGAMGWSWAWKIALRARLGDGDTARELFQEAVRPLSYDESEHAPVDGSQWGGLLPNLFSTHPPFQIDGNYGFTAALAELVVQSHGDLVRLLPALPAAWREGSLRGLRCRGGLETGLNWTDGVLTSVTVRRIAGDADSPVRIRYRDTETTLRLAVGEQSNLDGKLRPAC
ncbi:glycosyl hydrolase family 95 catalytic domain-containing protein [Streptomyces sp. NPDC088725]|uniref:glycosyl hydrolase family 95 catalytic domain-containing protein n=1 Tax=Streptomyces sp. NPDC088725 TaxID=3365873 RepID=UPI00382B7A62